MLRLSVRRKKSKDYPRAKTRGRLRFFLTLIIFCLAVFLVIGAVLRAATLKNYLFKPLSPLIAKNLKFSGSEKITVAIVGNPVVLVSFDQKEPSLSILEIPADVYGEVLPSYGFYPLSSAFGLGQLENPPNGPKVFLTTVSSFFGGPVDFYVQVKSMPDISLNKEQVLMWQREIKGLNAAVYGVKSLNWIPENVSTNLTLFDLYRLLWKVGNIRSDKINYYQAGTDLLEDLTLADGKRVKTINQAKLGELSKIIFEDREVLAEKLSVEILNASAEPGLSTKIGQILGAAGIDVAFAGNADNRSPHSALQVSEAGKDSQTVHKISRFFNLKPTVQKESKLFDVTLILGEDLAKEF